MSPMPPSNLPPFGAGGQPFDRRIPLLGGQGQHPTPEQQQEAMRHQIATAVRQLALGLYAGAVGPRLAAAESYDTLAPSRLQQLARDAETAAKCFYQGVGTATFQGLDDDDDGDDEASDGPSDAPSEAPK